MPFINQTMRFHCVHNDKYDNCQLITKLPKLNLLLSIRFSNIYVQYFTYSPIIAPIAGYDLFRRCHSVKIELKH